MTLYKEVMGEIDRLDVEEKTAALVAAALDGEEAVERLLEGQTVESSQPKETGSDDPNSSLYLRHITVSGFRGIGPEAKLEFQPGPGLTVVVGRNGSGKSSFAEALEVLLTGDTLRWANRRGPWKEGWRNLHHPAAPRVTACFQVEGKRGPTTVNRSWSEDAGFAEARTTAQHHGEKRTDLAGIGWEHPLDLYRPLLSYNEFGMIATDRPSRLFDILSAVLGLESLDEAVKALAAARLLREKLYKQVNRERLDNLIPTLDGLDDERAEAAVAALRKRGWDLNTLATVASASRPEQDSLRDLSSIEVPDAAEVQRIAEEIHDAAAAMSELAGTEAERASQLARIIKTALDHHDEHGEGTCPVCGMGTLDGAWRRSATEQITRLRSSARRYRVALKKLQRAEKAARSITKAPSLPAAAGVDTEALHTAWTRWGTLPEAPGEMAEHLLEAYRELVRKATKVSEQAASRYSEREKEWAAVLPDLMTWLGKARQAKERRKAVKQIKQAESALKAVIQSLREARWAPIETKALDLWGRLRLQSNVDLRSVDLAGSSTRRRVDLTVEVDGTEAPALAVVSQGEISCLALSLFFPRATLPASPFRFLVIDDPVQAMDPARVDGLARVFAEIAADRQLIVFTHDDRLPESLRRLRIEHTCKRVVRRPGSLVETRDSLDPVSQCFQDARALALDDLLPEEVAARVVPGFCRSGLEAACIEVVRRRRLGRGEAHAEVEQVLEQAKRLTQKASLALFDDIDQGGRVYPRIRERWSPMFSSAFQDANRGAHRAHQGDLMTLINDCQGLAERIRRL